MRVLRRLAALLTLVVVVAFVPSLALADSPSNGQLLVPGDHHLPGESMDITGYGLDPGTALALTLVRGSQTATLGNVTVLEDGTFSMPATVPAAFPTGYADVVATGSGGGNSWTTVILVGERAEGPQRIDGDGPVVDTVAIGLLMAATGILIVLLAARRYRRG